MRCGNAAGRREKEKENMQLEDFLRLLHVESGPDARGNYKCLCPAHDDHTASMSVGLGKNRKGQDIILLKCHQPNCGGAPAIVRALGLRMKDLTCEDRPPWEDGGAGHTVQTAKQTAPAKKAKPQAIADLPKTEKKDHGEKKLECAYAYRDEEGTLLYEALRYRYADGKKTFRQRRPDPENPGKFIFNMEGVRLVLYRLPEVQAAIRSKEAIWIAEGEKDADNLAKIGLCGTSSPMGAGKWSKGEYAEMLRGATVYILPDNDEPGWAHARDIAQGLENIAEQCRILDLKRIWPEIPSKHDVSDLIEKLGAEEAKKQLLQLASMQFTELSDMKALFARVPGYTIENGGICKFTADGIRTLCNFIAVPIRVITRDDGAQTRSLIEIKGWGAGGKALPLTQVEAGDFGSMGWIAKAWDIAASIQPGTQIKDQVRYAIAEAGRMTVQRETEYAHTGWRKMAEGWCYLHGDGAIGKEDARSSLPGALNRYGLSKGQAYTKQAGFAIGLSLMEAMTDEISVPLLASAYLAPLTEMLLQKQIPPSFALFLYGVSGSLKSTAAAMALSHFGAFDEKTPVASFKDTGNSAREKAFCLKDSMIWVDDYHPVTGQQEKRRMDTMAQDLARAFGDHAERGRLNADRTLQISRPPRCLCLMTGEDLPGIGASGLARFFIIDVKKGDIPITPALTQLQDAIRAGALQSAMRGYIQKLRGSFEKLPDLLAQEFLQLRQEAGKRLGDGAHGRSAAAIAHLMLGWKMMLAYGQEMGMLEADGAEKLMDRGWTALLQESARHGKEAQEDAPEMRYLQAISEMLASRQCYVIDQTPGAPHTSTEKPGMIGWMDEKYYYFLPDMTYQAVQILFQRQGVTFPLSMRATHRMLMEKKLLLPEGGSATRHKWVGNKKSIRLLFIPRHLIDGGEAPTEQQSFLQVDEPWPED